MSKPSAVSKKPRSGTVTSVSASAKEGFGNMPLPGGESEEPRVEAMSAKRQRAGGWRLLDVLVFTASLITIAVTVNVLANRETFRAKFDATKTRAYSLSPQTLKTLEGLTGQWTLALIMSESDVEDPTARRQIQEVLARFTEASPNVKVVRIDPSSAESAVRFDALLSELTAREQGDIDHYTQTIKQSLTDLTKLRMYAQNLTPPFQELLTHMPSGDGLTEQLTAQQGRFANVAQEGGKITDQVNTALSVNEGQPLPDYESARSILTAVLNQWANELADLVRSGRQISERTDLDQAVMYSARAMFNPATLDPMTQQLATTADTLKHLPELDVSAVTRQLARGEALLVMSPTRSVIIPSNQLFPKSNVRVRGHGGITYDQRFNGEQLIASAMQSLLVKTMPRVVFVHGEERSILAADSNRIDARAMSLVLKTARYKVSEWNAGKDQSRPKFDDDAPVVWVVIPPQARKTLDATPGERALLAGVKGLIDDGESVLLSFHPSLLPKYGQPDPWVALTKGLGFTPQTQNIVVERQVVAEDQTETQRGLALVSYPTEHPISLSLQDQVSYFALPVPLAVDANLPAQERMQKLIEIAPTRERWLDKDWLNTPNGKNDGPTASMSSLDKTATAAVAIERPNPLGRGEQRIEAVGSGSWMLSFISDVAVNDAGDRMVLAYPGNQQLMLSSVAWLSGHDELIGASTSGREVAQLNGVTAEAQHTWTWIVVGILPAGVVLAGLGAWLVRRL